MASSCVFCGATGKLTAQHILGDWLSRTPLDQSPVPHGTGWLNRLGRDLGTSPPYRRTVKAVCAACNNGWMSRQEEIAGRVLTPLILGEPAQLTPERQPDIAAWAQMTVLVAMLTSPDEDRAQGYGLPPSEYTQLYELRGAIQPLPTSQFWIGSYAGVRSWSVRVTPMVVVTAEGLPEPDEPQG